MEPDPVLRQRLIATLHALGAPSSTVRDFEAALQLVAVNCAGRDGEIDPELHHAFQRACAALSGIDLPRARPHLRSVKD